MRDCFLPILSEVAMTKRGRTISTIPAYRQAGVPAPMFLVGVKTGIQGL